MELTELLRALDKAITPTRGAAVTLVRLSTATGQWQHVAVGNMALSSLRRLKNHPLTVPGIVGARVRKVVETQGQLPTGDVVVLYTDGISTRFDLEPHRSLAAQAIADVLRQQWAKDHDDATCVVIRM